MQAEFGDKSIRLADGSLLGYKKKDASMFINTSTIYYGASGTGKSVAIVEQLFLLKDLIPRVVVFAPSESKNNTYAGKIPPNLIHPSLNRSIITKIYQDQSECSELYAIVNSLDMLRTVFTKMKLFNETSSAYFTTVDKIRTVEENMKNYVIKLSMSEQLSFAEKKELEAKALEKKDQSIIDLYKKAIHDNQSSLLQLVKEKDLQTVIKNVMMNPRLLLIFDDCVEQIKAISGMVKSRSGENIPSIMDTIFTRGRHDHCTIIVAAQDDNLITPTMRKNSYFSIFTDGECAMHFMHSKANSIMKKKQKRAIMACDAVFSDNSENNFKKLVYYRLGKDDNVFTYMIADRYPPFRMCSPQLWTLCRKIEEKNNQKKKKFLENYNK